MLVNTLKIIISEYTAGTRELYKGYVEQDTCTNYQINTNYKDAFPLEPHDPRYFVYFSPAKRNARLLKEYHQERKFGDLAAGVYADILTEIYLSLILRELHQIHHLKSRW